VSFGETEASFTIESDGLISAVVPANAHTARLRVASEFGTGTSHDPFIVAPRIHNFTPRQAPAGASVWITGDNLGHATSVSFHDGAPALFEILSDTEVRATVPSDAVDGPIHVGNAGGVDVSKLGFRVGTASAAGINLAWDDCGEAGTELRKFACDVNSGTPFALVASFVPPAGVAEFLGLSATLMVESDAEILPDLSGHGSYRNRVRFQEWPVFVHRPVPGSGGGRIRLRVPLGSSKSGAPAHSGGRAL
jgi:hypothetical protein